MMLHPATVHFAMVLPIVAAVCGVVYMITRKEILSKISTMSTVVAALAMIAVWYTGSQAGPQIYNYLSETGQATLIEHKNLGLYLAIAMGVIALIKMLGCKMKIFAVEVLAILLLLGATGVTLLQGKMGGEIVYNHGMPFKAYMIEDSLKDALESAEDAQEDEEKVEVFEDAIDDIKMLSEEVDAIYGNQPAQEAEDTEEE